MTEEVFNRDGIMWTSYQETVKGATRLMDNHFASEDSIRLSTGEIGYGRYNTMDHMFRPVFNKELMAAFMTTDSVHALIQKRAYSTEGMRLVMSKNSYQKAQDFKTPFSGANIFKSKFNGRYLGAGAAQVPDGSIAGGTIIKPELLHIPFKEIVEFYPFPLSLDELQKHGDDVGSKEDYAALMSQFFSDEIDKTILRPITTYQPRTDMFDSGAAWYDDDGSMPMETSLNGLARILSSGSEIGKTYKDMSGNDVTIMPSMVCPWGGLDGDMSGMRISTYGKNNRGRRLKGFTITPSSDGVIEEFDSNGDLVYATGAGVSGTHTKNPWDAQVLDLEGASLTLEKLNQLHVTCKQNRKGMSDKGCFFVMSPLMWQKLNNLVTSQKVYNASPEVTRKVGIGGMSGIEGENGGIQFASYNYQAIMVSQNLAFDFETEMPSTASFGDLFDIDGEHLWMSLLTPLELWYFKDPSVTFNLQERNMFHIREELRCDQFVSQGRITNVANA